MSKTYLSRKARTLKSARLLGVGAVIVGTLASCSSTNESKPAPTSVSAPSTAEPTQAPAATTKPAAATTQAAAESTQAPAATPEPTAVAIPPTATTEPTVATIPPTATASGTGRFKDGQYVGAATRADRWGNLQVRATIQGGQLVKVDIVEFPHSTRRSNLISQAALPILVSEAIQKQDANVDVVSRATDTSLAFDDTLGSALSNAASGKP